MNGDTTCSRCVGNGPQRLGKEIGGIRNQRNNQDHLDHSILKIGKKTQKSLRDLMRFIDFREIPPANSVVKN